MSIKRHQGNMTPSLLIIGIGNDWRGDDAVGRLAARDLLARPLRPGVTVIEHSGDGASLMERWIGAEMVLLIDAAAAGGAPGTIYRIDAHHDRLPADLLGASSHLLGVAAAVELARALGQLPPRFIVYGVEGADFTLGAPVSPAVAASLPILVEQIVQEISNGTNDRLSP